MKRFHCSLLFGMLAVLLTLGASAQQNTPSQPTDPTAQQPAQPPQGSPSQPQTRQTPDTTDQTGPAADSRIFVGTIVKAGDKYVLQDTASGTTYDIDHQSQLQQYEGKKVRVRGTLDASGKMIHVQ
jgi:hypothetical protein